MRLAGFSAFRRVETDSSALIPVEGNSIILYLVQLISTYEQAVVRTLNLVLVGCIISIG